MKKSVIIALQDVGQARRDADNLVQLTVSSADTKIPFVKIQFQRHELKKFLDGKYIGHLNGQTIDGFIAT